MCTRSNFIKHDKIVEVKKLWSVEVFLVVILDLVATVNTMIGLRHFLALRKTVKTGSV
jgi:hypothetical protein